jgi:hypothetical protein
MRTLRHKLVALVVVASLVIVIGSVMGNRQVAAQQGGPRVSIVAPLPLPVDDSSETVLVLDQTIEVSPGPVGGDALGPIDVSGFKQIRVATRLVSGGAVNLQVFPAVSMGAGPLESIPLAEIDTANGTVAVDIPGRTMFVRLLATSTTTAQIQVYGRK